MSMAGNLNDLSPQLADLVARGKLIDAIRLLREAKGVGLREAKDAIDRLRAQGTLKLEPREARRMDAGGTEPQRTEEIGGSSTRSPPRAMSFAEATHRVTPEEARRVLGAAIDALKRGDWRVAHRQFSALSTEENPRTDPPVSGTRTRHRGMPLQLSRPGLAPGEVPRTSEWLVVGALLLLVIVGWLAFR
jgi:hypothetical protein